MAADLINLNKARKARTKSADKAAAEENRVKFGRTKGQAAAARSASDQIARKLDDAKRER
jgi:hypothetical protein